MARGGKRVGGGRKAGTANIKTRAIADEAVKKGITPLEVMLELMRKAWEVFGMTTDPVVKKEQAAAAASYAKDAAPYMHPKLQPVDGRGSTDMNINIIIQKLGDEK